ncbi:hypothetical protein [Bartonella jaculi]|uniref:Uncharacterized protein n=1 Tax=Bartonella jaculi TaxID=686226 RepID=A0ABP9N422_9HYPH
MFKIFKNRMWLYIFTGLILCFLPTVESHANIIKDRFQEGESVAAITSGKNRVVEEVDMAVIHGAEEQGGWLALGKIERVSLFAAFWGGVGIIYLFSSLATGNISGVVVSIIALLFSIQKREHELPFYSLWLFYR